MPKRKNKKPLIVGFVALGCAKNTVDSEKMLAEIVQAGFLIATDTKEADVVVINTCGFIEPAKQEALEAIKEAVGFKRDGRVRKVIVAGCLPERLGDELFDEADGIDVVVGLGQRDDIVEIIKKTLRSGGREIYLEPSTKSIHDDTGRLLITAAHWAYLRISEGCDHRCSFCTIPAIRGRFRSKSEKQILTEADELARAGVVELNIIGQDTAYYGRDLKMKNGLAKLLKKIEKTAGVQWIRLMYLCPVGINEQLIETIAASKKIVHYLDIPIQHINDDILRAMRRPDTKKRICKLIENLRAAISDVVLRTTMIVGFPGETDQQFKELLEFVEWAQFDALGAFTYYCESGTEAAEMSGQIADKVKQQRLERLMLTQQKIAFAKNKAKIGCKIRCLLDSVNDKGIGQGRFYGQAPDIDSICIVNNPTAQPGEFFDAKVVDTKDYDLIVSPL